ncbi:hypothetical protein [Aneurinibacillus migulanus]|uniref:hypothetical protein n=1 Tax=Aneurinibacillus migulanus TaxID=47500 RepID=UPI00137934D4|nr:hypothetical protein [Aneurinibacillus migulanus]
MLRTLFPFLQGKKSEAELILGADGLAASFPFLTNKRKQTNPALRRKPESGHLKASENINYKEGYM